MAMDVVDERLDRQMSTYTYTYRDKQVGYVYFLNSLYVQFLLVD